MMISFRCYLWSCVVSVPLVVAASSAGRTEQINAVMTEQIASRCADFGDDFVDLGNGVCGRIGNHIRVQLGTRASKANSWASSGTANAAMRTTDGLGMVPSSAQSSRLRVRSGLESYNLFR